MFLNPEVHCVKCSFPLSSTFICIGDKNYINKCSNTNVWLDGNFIAGFTMLLCHYAHSSGTPLVGNKKNLPQLIHAIFSKQKLVISGVKPLPKDVDRLVAILHNDGHYILLEVNISERKFLIYDGLSHELLNGRTTSSLFSRSVCCWICPLTPHQQYVFQMLQFHQLFHAAENLGISSMVIKLFIFSLHPQTKNWNSGD